MSFRDENIRFAQQLDISPRVFSDPVITVELRRDAADSQGNIAAFIFALNLLSRTFERVHAVFPAGTEAPRHPWNLKTVSEMINELNDTVDGTICIGPPNRSDVVLSIGDRPSIPANREVFVHGSHWRAALDCDLSEAGEGVFGPLYAACMGAAQVLLHLLNGIGAAYQPMAPFNFSLLDLLSSGADCVTPKPIFIQETHLVGVGAVGSAAIYTLAHLDDIAGVLHLIDNERVDKSNLNRYVLMRRRDIGRWKVDIANAALHGTSIKAVPYPGAFSSYAYEYGDSTNLLLSPVDSKEGRRRLAKMLPRRVINAATRETTVTVSTHGFADGKACLHCLYMTQQNKASHEEIMAADMGLPPAMVQELVGTNAPLDAQIVARIEQYRGVEPGKWSDRVGLPIDSFYIRAVCGEAALPLPTASVIAPLSFVSASAGVLLAAELVKVGHPELSSQALDNHFSVDTLHRPNPMFRRRHPQEPSGRCICWDPDYIEVYSQKYPSN